MCNCAKRRTDIAAGTSAALRGDLVEARERAAAVARSVLVDLEMARQAAVGMLRRV